MRLAELVRSRFVRNAATLQMGAALNAAGNFISSILLAHVLGAEKQGLFYSAMVLYGIFYLFGSMGLVQGAVSQVAASNARGDVDRVAQWMAFIIKAWLVVGTGLAVACWFFLPWLAEQMYDDRQLGVWASWLAFIPILETPRSMVRAAFEGTRRMLPLAQMENGTEVMRVFLVVSGALITGSPVGPVIGSVLATACGGLLSLELYRQAMTDGQGPGLPGLRRILRQIRGVPLMRGARLGIRIGLLRIIDAVMIESVPTLVLLKFADPTWVAYFRIAQRLMRIPLMIGSGITRTALPALSELAGIKDMQRFKTTFLRVTFGGGGLMAAAVLVWLPLVPLVVGAFYPEDYGEPVWTLCTILLVGSLVISFAGATDPFYIVTNTMKVAIRIAIGSVTTVFILTILFSYWWPRTGTAWGVVCGMSACILHYIYITYYFRKHRGEAIA